MTQEQPFEIKEVRELQVAVDPKNGVCLTFVKSITEDYITAANAEIRRLQDVNMALTSDYADVQNENKKLKQQLADAPTWGEWVKSEVVIDGIVYEVEFTNGSTILVYNEQLRDVLPLNQYNDNKITRFRRLNYTPKPTREVEKTYDTVDGGYTAKEIAEKYNGWGGQIARDLLAAQAELRELKGER